jgi:hypothetical protein
MPPLSIRSATSSLRNHILFILVFASLPVSVLFCVWAYQDHELTLSRVLWIPTVWTGAGILGALVGWHYRPRSNLSPFWT